MNKVCLIGRLTADIEVKNSNEISWTRFTLAVNRKYQNEKGEYDADFISCVAWRERAELIAKHFGKGSQIGIEGHIQTGSYDKEDGSKGYLTDVIVDSISFVGSKKTDDRPAPEYNGAVEDSFDKNLSKEDVQTLVNDEDLPF